MTEFSRTVFKWVGWTIGLLSGVFGIWSTVANWNVESLVFHRNPVIVFEPPQGFQVDINYERMSFNSATDRVTINYVAIWNNGNTSISKSDVRRPITIYPTAGRILDIKLIDQRSSLDNNFALNTSSEGKTRVTWEVFDPGMALLVAVLHVGGQGGSSDIGVDGAFKPSVKFSSYGTSSLSNVIVIFFLTVMALFSVGFGFIQAAKRGIYVKDRYFFLTIIATALCAFLVISYVVGPSSPFEQSKSKAAVF